MDKRHDEVMLAISVNNDLMRQRHYRPDIVGNILLQAEYDTVKRKYYDTKANIKKYIRQTAGISNYLAKTILQVFLDNNVIYEEDNKYYVNDAIRPFIKISAAGLRSAGKNLSPYVFKVYCYLMCKQALHDQYHYTENYYFSEKELVEYMGYALNQDSYKTVKEHLYTLEKVGLIKISESKSLPGRRGKYRELYKAYSISNVQLESSKEMLLEGKADNSIKEIIVEELYHAEPEQLAEVYKEELIDKIKSAEISEAWKMFESNGYNSPLDNYFADEHEAKQFMIEQINEGSL